jgi:hypothetical protein
MSSPAHKIRIGNLHATIWRNPGEKGSWYSVNISRSYKVEDGWRETDNLGYEDLLPAAKLADLAHTWIMHQLVSDAKGRKASEQTTK